MNTALLATERLILRYPEESDLEFLVGLWSDEEMTRHTGGPRRRDFLEEEFRRAILDPAAEEFDLWVMEEKATGMPVGHAGLLPKEVGGKAYIELNYFIEKTRWGSGFAGEIACALVEYAFRKKGLTELIAVIHPENAASAAVVKKAGMRFWTKEERSGVLKHIYRIDR